jgi:hypothetical protein
MHEGVLEGIEDFQREIVESSAVVGGQPATATSKA